MGRRHTNGFHQQSNRGEGRPPRNRTLHGGWVTGGVWGAVGGRRQDESHAARRLRRQLQPARGGRIQHQPRRDDGRHRVATQSLVRRPERVLRFSRPHHHKTVGRHSQGDGGWRVKVALAIHHDHPSRWCQKNGTVRFAFRVPRRRRRGHADPTAGRVFVIPERRGAVMVRIKTRGAHGHPEGERSGARARPCGQHFDHRSGGQPALRQSLIDALDAGGDHPSDPASDPAAPSLASRDQPAKPLQRAACISRFFGRLVRIHPDMFETAGHGSAGRRPDRRVRSPIPQPLPADPPVTWRTSRPFAHTLTALFRHGVFAPAPFSRGLTAPSRMGRNNT